MTAQTLTFAPGRVNLIGEHTDYNAGLALPFAIDAGVTVRAWPLPDRRIEAVALDLGQQDEFGLDDPQPASGWRAFVRGAVAELPAQLVGAHLEITGTVPRGSGLSSSAALEVALVLALLAVSGAPEPDRLELAKICSRIENRWTGAQTGLLDQISSLFGEQGHALRIDFRSLVVTPVKLELGGWRLVTVDSGEAHANAASGYNRRRRECAQAAAALGIESLREARSADVERLPEPLRRRARHVVTENERVEATVAALAGHDLVRVGELLDASHASLRDDYEISTAAVEATVERCKRAGAAGARIVGGGFGGHVLALLSPDAGALEGAREVRPGPGARIL